MDVMKFALLSVLMMASISLHAGVTNDELVIKIKAGKSLPTMAKSAQVQNLFGSIFIIRNINAEALEKKLKNHPDIEYTERNQSRQVLLPAPQELKDTLDKNNIFGQFNDPKANKVWSFEDAEYFGVSVDSAYKLYSTPATTNVIVAVIDTGVDFTHEDLKDVMWTNPNEIPGNGIDDDNNGYIDDIYGINVVVRDDRGVATTNIKDTHSHGTHVSGTIAARQNNKVGIAGIASNVRIMAIRGVPNNSDETDINIAEAFVYAAKNGAKIINCSFGKGSNEGGNLIPETLKYIQDTYGVLVVAASGNSSQDIDKRPTYPASHKNDNLLIVASSTSNNGLSNFSNYGKISVDIVAPGSSIYSTTPGNRYESMSGTSMASPTTVGVAAEVLSHYPNLGPLQLKKVLMDSVTIVERFKEKVVSGGRIDLLNALELAKTIVE